MKRHRGKLSRFLQNKLVESTMELNGIKRLKPDMGNNGWELDYDVIENIQKTTKDLFYEDVSLEQAEAVALALIELDFARKGS